VAERLGGIQERFAALQQSATQGSVLREGFTVVIAGRPNAGKSSLLNRLAGHDAAIVTDIPGTTRDLLHEHINLEGLPLHVIDTAGLRDSGDAVEVEGVRRAWNEMHAADRVLLVVDDAQGFSAEDERILERLPASLPVTVVYNKIDLTRHRPRRKDDSQPAEIALSAKTGEGLDLLCAHLQQTAGFHATGEDVFMARRRHLEALTRAGAQLQAADQRLQERAGELLAEELRLVQQSLNEITGEFTSEDLLAKIFSSFCVGK
jgi:tRNA modification GTPase